jgi:hypothetical protein
MTKCKKTLMKILKKMKKVLFFALLLACFGAANVNSQVRIGGNGQPHNAAVLDLNADNSGTPTGNKGALALPRVSLASAAANLNGTTPAMGMLVYNTGGTLSAGVYYWNGSAWVNAGGTAYSGSTSVKLSGTSFVRTALTGDVTAAENSNVTAIANNAVTSAKIADGTITTLDLANKSVTAAKLADGAVTTSIIAGGAVTADKLGAMGATTGAALIFNGTAWQPMAPSNLELAGGTARFGYVLVNYAGAPVENALPTGCMLRNEPADSYMHGYIKQGTYWMAMPSVGGTCNTAGTGNTVHSISCLSRRCCITYNSTGVYSLTTATMLVPVMCE